MPLKIEKNFLRLQADNISGTMLLYDTDIKRRNLVILPVTEEIRRLNQEIKRQTRELLFPHHEKNNEDSKKGFHFIKKKKFNLPKINIKIDLIFLTNIKEIQQKEKDEFHKITEIFDEEEEERKDKQKQKVENCEKSQNKSELNKITIIPNKTNLSLQESLSKKSCNPINEFVFYDCDIFK